MNTEAPKSTDKSQGPSSYEKKMAELERMVEAEMAAASPDRPFCFGSLVHNPADSICTRCANFEGCANVYQATKLEQMADEDYALELAVDREEVEQEAADLEAVKQEVEAGALVLDQPSQPEPTCTEEEVNALAAEAAETAAQEAEEPEPIQAPAPKASIAKPAAKVNVPDLVPPKAPASEEQVAKLAAKTRRWAIDWPVVLGCILEQKPATFAGVANILKAAVPAEQRFSFLSSAYDYAHKVLNNMKAEGMVREWSKAAGVEWA